MGKSSISFLTKDVSDSCGCSFLGVGQESTAGCLVENSEVDPGSSEDRLSAGNMVSVLMAIFSPSPGYYS